MLGHRLHLRLIRKTRDAAARAIRAYLDCTATTLSRQNQASGLVRAWTIARLVGVNEFTAELTAALSAIADAAVNDQKDAYAAIRALSALTAPPPRGVARQPNPAVDNLLERALTAYPQVHVIRDIAVLIRRHAGNDTVRIANAGRHEVSVMLAEAEAATDPLVIRTLFADAASAARPLGLTDLERTAVTRLQSAPPVPWTYQEYSVTTPVAFFDSLLPGFKQAVDWRRALGIWLHTRAPSGRFEDNEANARRALGVRVE